MIEEIGRTERKGRKPHQCYHCYRMIPATEVRDVFTGKMDGSVYTLHSHLDCQAMSNAYVANGYAPDYWDGVPPLADEMRNSGEFEHECAYWRGQFPHVVCRIEFSEQIAALRFGESVFA